MFLLHITPTHFIKPTSLLTGLVQLSFQDYIFSSQDNTIPKQMHGSLLTRLQQFLVAMCSVCVKSDFWSIFLDLHNLKTGLH